MSQERIFNGFRFAKGRRIQPGSELVTYLNDVEYNGRNYRVKLEGAKGVTAAPKHQAIGLFEGEVKVGKVEDFTQHGMYQARIGILMPETLPDPLIAQVMHMAAPNPNLIEGWMHFSTLGVLPQTETRRWQWEEIRTPYLYFAEEAVPGLWCAMARIPEALPHRP